MSNTTSQGTGSNVFLSTTSVLCPLPVSASEPYSVTTNLSAFLWRAFISFAARSGPIVCELEGPRPILYNSLSDCMVVLRQIKIFSHGLL